ncbi:hypothetical protein MPDQ_004581 [Monascus purpureus]|uniref:Ketoreductase (KR) domain-containing protein n=1 Tax=Monascus purpureus TaxID=5098 RepID=A0A507R7K8_MONPU|nr:hypothetical protein MPDQ_004581 [Monascus purpureus]
MASTIILNTGTNFGTGFATSKVLACASETYHVIMASRSEEKAKAALAKIEALNPKGSLSTLLLDVTDEQSAKAAAVHV